MTVLTPQPLWHASSAARITWTYDRVTTTVDRTVYDVTHVTGAVESEVKTTVGDLD